MDITFECETKSLDMIVSITDKIVLGLTIIIVWDSFLDQRSPAAGNVSSMSQSTVAKD